MLETTPTLAAAEAMEPIRIGCVRYLNTLPLVEGLGRTRNLRLRMEAPARLIDLLLDREIDLGLVSLIDYQRSPEPLALLPVGMIGCDGPTMTVRIFSARPLGQVEVIHADAESHTSATMLKLIWAHRFGRMPRVEPFDAAPGHGAWPETVLLIGDKVMADHPPDDRHIHGLDLGAAWKEMTGLPFVYAMWMCRAGDADDPRVIAAARLLDRQRRHNTFRAAWIVARRGPEHGWPTDDARTYLSELLRFDPDDRARAAVDEFFDRAHAGGLIAERRSTTWLTV